MGTVTWSQIGSVALNHIEDVSSTISGNIISFVYMAVNMANNVIGIDIGSPTVDDKYAQLATNLTVASILSRQEGVGFDWDYRFGEFNVAKGERADPKIQQMKFHTDMANMDVKFLRGAQPNYTKVNG